MAKRTLDFDEDVRSDEVAKAPRVKSAETTSMLEIPSPCRLASLLQQLAAKQSQQQLAKKKDMNQALPVVAGTVTASSAICDMVICRQAVLPHNLISATKPAYRLCGSASEPILYVSNIDGCRGRLIAGRVLDELLESNIEPPMPSPGKRGGVICNIHRDGQSATPWHTGLRALICIAEQLLTYLRQDEELSQRMPSLRRPQTGWNDTEVNVYAPGSGMLPHRDCQPEGSLVFIFCAGLACRSRALPGGCLLERILGSGDVMIFDGRKTWHDVSEVVEDTSPFPKCPWLGQRRLSALVRQRTPTWQEVACMGLSDSGSVLSAEQAISRLRSNS